MGFQSYADQQQFKAYQRFLADKIREFGWAVQGVFPTANQEGPPFGYTIGLTAAGLPELILSGPFPPNTMTSLLNNAASVHLKEEIKPGDLVDGVANLPFKAVEARVGDHVQQALNYFNDPNNTKGRIRLVQLLWSSKDGKWPGEDPDLDLAQELWTP